MAIDASKVRTIYAKEMREALRDRRTIFAALVVPLLLYPLMMLGMAQATQLMTRDIRSRDVVVAIVGANAAPGLVDRLRSTPNVRLDVRDASDARDVVLSKRASAAIVLVPGQDAPSSIEVVFNGADEMSREAKGRVESVLKEYRDDVVKARLASRDVDASILQPFEVRSTDSATATARGGFLLGRLAAMMLIFMSLIGAFYPALDLAAGEKERGTIETLLVSPASRAEIVMGKYLAVLTISIVTALVNLGSMSLTFSRLASSISQAPDRGGSDFAFSVTAAQFAIILLALLPFAALMSALAFAISTLARSFKEGQNYLTPLMVAVIVPANLALLPGVSLTTATALIPVLNATLLVRQALLGTVDPLHAALTIATTAALAVASLAFARSLFENEQVLLRDSGDLDWQFWRRPPGARAELEPWHGLLAFGTVLVLLYYVGSWAQARDLRSGLAITQVLLILAPALVALKLAGVSLREGLGLRPLRPAAALGALLAGLGGALVGLPATRIINRIIEPPPELMKEFVKIGEQLTPQSPVDVVVVFALVALLPGICEEALHRGVLMRGLLARFGPVTAIVTSGLLFGVFHLSVYRLVWTAALGVMLGWIAYRARSIVSSMIAHAALNGSLVLLSALPAARGVLGIGENDIVADPAPWVGPAGLVMAACGLVAILLATRRSSP